MNATVKEDGSTQDRLRELEAEVKQLREENAQLRVQLGRFEQGESASHFVSQPSDSYDEFVGAEGVLWKRAADGRFEKSAYCPKCRLVLLPIPSDHPVRLVCTRCRFEASFAPEDIPTVVARIEV